MSIEASLPMLLAILGVSCSVFGVNTLVMGRLCRSKGIELSREDITVSNDDYKDAVAKQRGVGECPKHR